MITNFVQSKHIWHPERLIAGVYVLHSLKDYLMKCFWTKFFSCRTFLLPYKCITQRNCVDKIPVYWQNEELKQKNPPLLLCQAVAVLICRQSSLFCMLIHPRLYKHCEISFWKVPNAAKEIPKSSAKFLTTEGQLNKVRQALVKDYTSYLG